ncbi:type II secretion system F family protein [soil metagenome]
MTGLVLALAGGLGVFLLYTSVALGWTGLGFGPAKTSTEADRARRRGREWLVQAGLGEIRVVEFGAVMGVLFLLGALMAFAIFGGILPAFIAGTFAASFPVASYRARRAARRAKAQETWPRMIEEIRILTSSLGRSIPQALFDVGGRGPEELRPAFAAAHREWLISTDFPRTLDVLKARLADPTADAACETLLVAHELGGTDLDRRLEALIEDRIQDTQGRKDARSQQAGVRFARRFVLIVPVGMAVAGMSVGNGRSAYQSGVGQLLVAIGIVITVACWLWAGAIMRLPEEQRVFHE